MTPPDKREWYSFDPNEPAIPQTNEATRKFWAAHPTTTFWRFTILGVDRQEPWLCIDGWFAPPEDQGPPPTDADLPVGFV